MHEEKFYDSLPVWDNVQKAISEMKAKNQNVIAIPGGGGSVLVKTGTREALERETAKQVIYKGNFDGTYYLVCRK